jgi:hypothetical protein
VSGEPGAKAARWWRGAAVVGAVLLVVLGAVAGVDLTRQLSHPRAQPPPMLGAVVVSGSLVVTHADGSVTIINLANLGLQGAGTKALFTGNVLYLVDRVGGTITRLDPASGAPLGTAWHAGSPLADGAVDDTGTVWGLTTDGRLHRLAWTNTTLADASAPTTVDGSGPASLLVANAAGVTVLAPEGGVAVRVGTSQDGRLSVPQLSGQLEVPATAPVDLVPVSMVDIGFVLIIGPNATTVVATGPYGCARPGQPAVQAGHIYVACLGAGKVLVLDAAGNHAPPDIDLGPNGDPVLSIVNGQLYATLPGVSGVTVDAAGSRHEGANTPPVAPAPVGLGTSGSVSGNGNAGSGGGGAGSGGGGAGSGGGSSPPVTPTTTKPPVVHQGDTVLLTPAADKVPFGGGACPAPQQGQCIVYTFDYYAEFATPPPWASFNGTCTLLVAGGGTASQTIACGNTAGVKIGGGDGNTWTVSVRACTAAGSCVTSNTVSVTTQTYEIDPV